MKRMRRIDVTNRPIKESKPKGFKKYKKENDLVVIKSKIADDNKLINDLKKHFKAIFEKASVINIIKLPNNDMQGKFCVDGVSGDFKIENETLHWRQMHFSRSGIHKINQ